MAFTARFYKGFHAYLALGRRPDTRTRSYSAAITLRRKPQWALRKLRWTLAYSLRGVDALACTAVYLALHTGDYVPR